MTVLVAFIALCAGLLVWLVVGEPVMYWFARKRAFFVELGTVLLIMAVTLIVTILWG